MRYSTTIVLLVALSTSLGCSRNDSLTLPPLVSEPSTRLPGKFVWHNLITPDAGAARDFYSSVFGWQLNVLEGGSYTEVSHGGRSLGGIIDASKHEKPPRSAVWLSGVSVPDVDDSLSSAIALGANQLLEPTDIPNVGRVAVISDPQGALLQLIRANDGDPQDTPALLNTWLWHELIADVPEDAASFYHKLLGYGVRIVGDGEAGYRVLTRDGAPRAGILENPFEETRPAWVPFIRVADPTALLPKVLAHGGRVVVEPEDDLRGSKLAVILDPSGAPLALQKWDPSPGEGR